MVQVSIGVTSKLTEILPINTKDKFPDTLKDFIRKWGAMDTFMSDNAWEQTSKKVIDILRH